MSENSHQIAVIIPAYKVIPHIVDVVRRVGAEVSRIYVVDDACPEQSGAHLSTHCDDPRVKIIRHEKNQGVGGALITGYKAALADGMEILVKLDGDGQMDPALIPRLVAPICDGLADYTKGNRFHDPESLESMPRVRLIGNAALSFLTKLSSGYWNIFDPTNGFTALHAEVARQLAFHKISKRYFFETDMLFRLNLLRAVVVDIPMKAVYGDEVSNLRIHRIVGEFFTKHVRNFLKRIFYNYYLRDMNVGSVALLFGLPLACFGTVFGLYEWAASLITGVPRSLGTIMLAAISLLVGLQFILTFISQDVAAVPNQPIHKRLGPPFRPTREPSK